MATKIDKKSVKKSKKKTSTKTKKVVKNEKNIDKISSFRSSVTLNLTTALAKLPDYGITKPSQMVHAHIDSFNWLFGSGGGLERITSNMHTVFCDANIKTGMPKIKLWIKSIQIGHPTKFDDVIDNRLFPNECRESHCSYSAPVYVTYVREIDDTHPVEMVLQSGQVPMMVRSKHCHLSGLMRSELVRRREEATESGGYFICNGNEKVMRLLIMPRRNYICALERASFCNRGPLYSPYATSIRSVSDDGMSFTINLHYCTDGVATLRLAIAGTELYTPIILFLHALQHTTDREIFSAVVAGCTTFAEHSFNADRIELMLRETRQMDIGGRLGFLGYIGSRFRSLLSLPESVSDIDAAHCLFDRHLFPHCQQGNRDKRCQSKYEILILMLRKLFSLVHGSIRPDNADALHMQEALLPGQLYACILRERAQEILYSVLARSRYQSTIGISSDAYWKKLILQVSDLGERINYFMATGNISNARALGLMQNSGFTIVGDRLNFLRFSSHFRAIHRGAYFAEMKTTTVRKLLPESWGFVCPVHTPDGSPCGLLNHLSATTVIRCVSNIERNQRRLLINTLGRIGMHSESYWRASRSNDESLLSSSFTSQSNSVILLPVLLDGIIIGAIEKVNAKRLCSVLRRIKVMNRVETTGVIEDLEIVCVSSFIDGAFPGVFLASNPARFTRPVYHLAAKSVEWISPLEQVFSAIAVMPADVREGETTHVEISATNILSFVASLTPFSDFNQSPRNMYQCQMGKQTMGSPSHSLVHRVDNKSYRLQTPQSALVRNTVSYEGADVDDYPLGANAVVALYFGVKVISYTGYDMEDAMIINESAYHRGFGHGSVYVVKHIDLADLKLQSKEPIRHRFCNIDPDTKLKRCESLDVDGLPLIGNLLQRGDPLYSVYDEISRELRITKLTTSEPAYIDQVRVIGRAHSSDPIQVIIIKLRYARNPVVGDKFSSRHGQKGVLSQLWPHIDMPFNECGISPDIIINPHAFPSRMTIGMLIESMAGKSACMLGKKADGTPFRYSETNRAVDYFGKQLQSCGFSHVGNETLYSGVSGLEFEADVFMGVVYYQRLRHMVSDKSQVRAMGPTNQLTHQPVHGRKRGGGIRFGEMERDSLLGHGAAFLLHDRLMKCSDYHTSFVCTICSSVQSSFDCSSCSKSNICKRVAMPYVFTYLLNELASMNIKLQLRID